jgi:putative DNA primase/helicase
MILKSKTPAGAKAGGRELNNARAGGQARDEYSGAGVARKDFAPLDVRGARFAELCEALGFPRNPALSDARRHRSGRRGSFVADLHTGQFFDHEAGVGGAAIELLIHAGAANDFRGAAAWLRAHRYIDGADPGRAARERRTVEVAAREALAAEAKRRKALAVWRAAQPITSDTLAARYLFARAIPAPWPPSLRFASRLWNAETRAELPALIAAVTPLDAPQNVRAIHRTWLVEPGCKAALATPKAALGAITECGVIHGEIVDTVLVAEGIETALSAGRALGLPSVAALGCANMRRLAIPASVRRVLIAPDRDASGAGELAARDLGQALIKRGVSAALAWPLKPFADWNAVAQAGVLDGGAHV